MTSRHRSLSQLTRSDRSECLKNALDVVLRKIGVNGCDVDSVVVLSLLRDVVNHDLRLRHVARPADFDVSARYDDSVHLHIK
jgi:hypothetical protein